MFCDSNFHKTGVILPILFIFILTHFMLSGVFVTIGFGEFHTTPYIAIFCSTAFSQNSHHPHVL